MSNTITAYFKGRVGVAESVYQNDYGIVMAFDSIDLPAHFDCYFSRLNQEEALPGLGADNRVTIPNSILANPGNVTIHIPLHTGEDDSEVEYVIYFKVIGRARPIDDGTPAQMTAIERALALLSQPITNIEEIVNEALSFTGDTFAEMKQELADDFAEYKGDVDDDIADFKTEIRGDIADVEHDFDVLDGQFQTAVAALTVDSEVQGIRTGDDGVTYTSAGEAVRKQFSDVKSAFGEKNLFDELTLTSGFIAQDGTEQADEFARKTDLFFASAGYYAFECTRKNLPSACNIRIHKYTSGGAFEAQIIHFNIASSGRFMNVFYIPYDMYLRVSVGAYTYGDNNLYYQANRNGNASDSLARTMAESNPNLIDIESVRKGIMLNVDGVQIDNSYGYISELIPVIAGEKYTISGTRLYELSQNTVRVFGYDYDKNIVGSGALATLTFPADGSSGSLMPVVAQTFIVPDDCYYVRVSNGYYNRLSCKLEFGEKATYGYAFSKTPPNEKIDEIFDIEKKNISNVISLNRGTINANYGVVTYDSSVQNELFSFMEVVQDGAYVCIQLPPTYKKLVYDIYLYDGSYTFIKCVNGIYIDTDFNSYVTGATKYRISIRAKDQEIITDDELADLLTAIKIVTVKSPILDKRPRYTLIGSPDIYHSPEVDYLVTPSTDANYIYAMYDALVEAYPNNISKEKIGEAFNLPIYCYTFQPTIPKTWHHYGEQWNKAEWGNDPRLPMILIVAGTHGNERATVYDLAFYMSQMWGNDADSETNFVRDNAIIKVVPILNVSGFADNTRGNRNNVNLNRDFGAFSQVESRCIRDLYIANKDYIRIMVDYHQTPTRPAYWGDPTDELTQNIFRTLAMPLGNYWESQKPELAPYAPHFEFWYFDSPGAQSSWFSAQGVIATTCESAWNIDGMKGDAVWGTNDLFTEKCGIDLLGNTLIQFLKAVPNFEQSYFERYKTLDIVSQPTPQTVESGDIAEFVVGAVGYGLTYQWQYCADNSRQFTNVATGYVYPSEVNPYAPTWSASANSNIWPNLRVQASSDNNGYTYRCVVTDQFLNVAYSAEVKLTVV